MAALNVRELGDFIRDQRRAAQISLRELAKQAGVSNPYLSQIERGLRRPSAEILQQIAKALRISAEALYVQAGILEERQGGDTVMAAVLADISLSERQKQVVLDIYEAFCKENAVAAHSGVGKADSTATGRIGGGTTRTRRTRPTSTEHAPASTATTEAPPDPAGTTGATATEAKASGTGATESGATESGAPGNTSTPKRRPARRTSGVDPAEAGSAAAVGGGSTAPPTAASGPDDES
ncbi:HTH-type transcriptional regulator, competence development regulator [Frankia sp. AiPs1]|uniref:helix-turn-helix domain-containing protein n=1 Tax=Frankia sp. AiPa1 TaxID=573492 RepID=UPI00202B84E0|nr:helix-turn-helix domain-containing protein [Frankia sp. AiPa1]MCL9759905.1 helix-turn-helix domain-containing protein [Frankia sp. AiPa1]